MAEDSNEERPRIIGGGKVLRGASVSSTSIEKSSAPPPKRGVVSSEDFEAKQTANKIIEDAKLKAEEIRAQALVEREEVFRQAAEEARAQIAPEVSAELLKAKMQAGEMMKRLEGEIVDLALKVSAKIIGRDLERDPALVAEIAATAIETTRASKAMVLRVNPKDGATLRAQKSKLLELIGRTVDVSIRDDADVEVGGCVVQTEFGTIDAQIKTQYDMLRNVLLPDSAKKEGPK